MNTLDEVKKIVGELDREPLEMYDASGEKSTDEILSALLNRPVQERSSGASGAGLGDTRLEYYIPLRSDRKVIGGIITFFKRVVRRILKYLFLPVVDKQNKINAQIAAAVYELIRNQTEQSNKLNILRHELRAEIKDRD